MRRIPLLSIALAALLALPGAAAPALAQQDTSALVDRIQRLERQIDTLETQVFRGGGDSSRRAPLSQPAATSGPDAARSMPDSAAARLQLKLTEFEEVLTRLTGQVEETRHSVRQVESRLDRLVADVDFRLNRIESRLDTATPADKPGTGNAGTGNAGTGNAGTGNAGAGNFGTGDVGTGDVGTGEGGASASGGNADTEAMARTPPAPAPGDVLPDGTVNEQYSHAFDLLRQGDFVRAEQAMRAFLARHPEHELAGNAQYWLGETFYVRGDFQKASIMFLEGYRDYPKSGKAPDNLLKLGLALGALGKTDEACAALGRLSGEFPSAADAIKRRAERERDTLGCQG